MKLKENIAISETGFLFDSNSGDSFSVNSSGKEIIKLISSGKNSEEIKSVVLEKYDINEITFERYMEDFLHALRRFNLIEKEEYE